MKSKLFVLFIISLTSFNCSDTMMKQEQSKRVFTDLEIKEMNLFTQKLTKIWASYPSAQENKKKLLEKLNINNFIQEYRSSLNQEDKKFIDVVINSSEMESLNKWFESIRSKSVGSRVQDYTPSDILSITMKTMTEDLASRLNYTAEMNPFVTSELMENLLSFELQIFENEVTNNSQLTISEKEILYTHIAQQYDLLPSIIETSLTIDGDAQISPRVAGGFWRKLGSIIAHVVVFAIVVATIAATAGAASPVVISVFGAAFTIVNVGAAIGAGIGLIVGGAMAIENQCLDLSNGFNSAPYTEC